MPSDQFKNDGEQHRSADMAVLRFSLCFCVLLFHQLLLAVRTPQTPQTLCFVFNVLWFAFVVVRSTGLRRQDFCG